MALFLDRRQRNAIGLIFPRIICLIVIHRGSTRVKKKIITGFICLIMIIGLGWGYRANRDYLRRYPRVQAAMVLRGDLSEDIEVSGKILVEEIRDLYPSMNVKVKNVYVRDGDMVDAGQPILTYDYNEIELQLARCRAEILRKEQQLSVLAKKGVSHEVVAAQGRVDKARLEMQQAERDYRKRSDLYKDGAVSRNDYERYTNIYESAKVQLEQAEEELRLAKIISVSDEQEALEADLRALRIERQNLQKYMTDLTLTSPIKGRISIITLKPGERANVDFRAAQVIDEKSIVIEADVPAEDALKVRVGDPAEMSYGTIANPYPAKVVKILPPVRGHEGYGNVRVRLVPTDPNQFIIPGTPVRIRIRVGRSAMAVSVPIESIQEERRVERGDREYFSIRPATGEKQKYVYVLRDCSETLTATKEKERRWMVRDNIYQVRKVFIKTGVSDVDRVEVLQGLKPFEQVVVYSDREIRDYDRVIVVSRDERYKKPMKSGSGE